MLDFLQNIFAEGSLIPHERCYLWNPELAWLHIASDSLIALAYYSLGAKLLYRAKKQQDLPFKLTALLFGVFLVFCGTNHILEVWTLWFPAYWLSGILKALMALIWVYTALIVLSLMPKALTLPILVLEAEIAGPKRIDAQLEQTERQHRAFLNNLPYMAWLKDKEGRLRAVNEPYGRVCGLNLEEIIGKTDLDLWPVELAQSYRNDDQEVMKTGKCKWVEEPLVDKAGKLAWIETVKMPFLNDKGEIIGTTGFTYDITERRQTEASLRRAQEFSRVVVENVSEGVVACDADGNLTLFNRTAREWHGVDPRAIPPEEWASLYNLFGPDGVTPLATEDIPLLRAFRGECVREAGMAIVAKGQPPRYVLASGDPLFDAKGCKIGAVVVMHDITQRQQAEAALRQQAQIINQVHDAVVATDLDGYVTSWNQSAECLYSYTAEEALGKHISFIYPSEQHEFLQQQVIEPLQEKGSHQTEVKLCRKTGEDFCAHLGLSLLRDSQGEVVGIINSAMDITQRKQAEAALRESEERLQKVLENMPVMMNALDDNGNFIVWNKECERVTGYSAAEIINNPKAMQLLYPDATYLQEMLVKWNQHGNNYRNWEWDMVTQEGTVKTAAWSNLSAQILIQGWAAWGVGVDVTERKQAEEALRQSEAELRQKATQLEQALHELQKTQVQLIQSEKMSSLGQLVAGVAHEINNPVNFIYGNLTYVNQYAEDLLHLVQLYQEHYPLETGKIQAAAEAIELDFLKEDLPQTLASMKVGTDRIRQIVLSLLTFSRAEQTHMKLGNIHEGLDSTLLILTHRLKAKPNHPAIQVIKEYGDLPLVPCYLGQLNQVFMNILTNAIDAMDGYNKERSLEEIKNHPSTIWIRTELQDAKQVMIQIIDNGPGMTEEIQRRLFDLFFTTKPVGSGTGLGMSISYQIVVEKHGGELQCISTPGQGTKFLISLPIDVCSKKG